MPGYSFHIKLPKAASASLQIESSRFEWPLGDGLPVLRLSSGSSDVPISKADVLYFASDGWPDEESALSAGNRYLGALARTFACLRVGVDYGDRAAAGGGFTEQLIQDFWHEHGVRVINEQPGIMVYETEPQPVFAGASGTASLAIHANQFEQVFAAALRDPRPLQAQERVSIALYNAAFFEISQDARFLLNMMALEALVSPALRSVEVVAHVDDLITATRNSDALDTSVRDSLVGSLEALKWESIGQAGRRLVSRLGNREYDGESPVAFFSRCYSLRSRLVHGDADMPSRDDVSSAAANLEVMVSDLLGGGLAEVRQAAVSG